MGRQEHDDDHVDDYALSTIFQFILQFKLVPETLHLHLLTCFT